MELCLEFLFIAESGCIYTVTIYINHTLLAHAVFYCFATTRCLNPTLSHREWHHSGQSIQHPLHSEGSYSTNLLWSSVWSAMGLEDNTFQKWTVHSPYQHVFQHHWQHGETYFFFFFFKPTTVFPTSILNPAAYQQISPVTHFSSEAAAVISRLYEALGEREHFVSLSRELCPNSSTASSQSNSKKQKWFLAPLTGTRPGSFYLDWFQPQWKYKTTRANGPTWAYTIGRQKPKIRVGTITVPSVIPSPTFPSGAQHSFVWGFPCRHQLTLQFTFPEKKSVVSLKTLPQPEICWIAQKLLTSMRSTTQRPSQVKEIQNSYCVVTEVVFISAIQQTSKGSQKCAGGTPWLFPFS